MQKKMFRKTPAILAAAGLALALVLTGCFSGGGGRADSLPPTVMAVSTGFTHTVALKTDGSIWAWGQNMDGRTGFGFQDGNITSPTRIPGDSDWVSVVAGGSHTVAIRSDGSLWAWGWNLHGQLGDGTVVNRWTPTRIGTDADWVSAAAGGSYTVAIRSDGSLWAWGSNEFGQLGDGTTTSRLTPTRIGADNNWASAAASIRHHTAAIRTDGTLWVWGRKDQYTGWPPELIRVIQDYGGSPVQIGGDASWASVAAGGSYIAAIQADGSLWTWGRNCMGQLGNGTRTIWEQLDGEWTEIEDNDQLAPARVGAATWASVAAGGSHTVAVQTDGSLWAWGANWSGQLGLGDAPDLAAPARVGTGNGWVSAVAGGSHTLALQADGSLWAWGGNWGGHLGDGTTADRGAPVRVMP